MDTGVSGARCATSNSPSLTTGRPARSPPLAVTVAAPPVELAGTHVPFCSRADVTDRTSVHLDSLPGGEEDKEWRLHRFSFYLFSFFHFHERSPVEVEDNVAHEPLSMAPGDAVKAFTMIGSVQPESYVTVRAPPMLAPG